MCVYTVSGLCPLCAATATHAWMCTHSTAPQPCKHILKWSLAFHTLLAMHHASPHGGGLAFIDLPATYSFVSTAWLVAGYLNTACTHPTPLQTDLSLSLFLLSSLLPFPLRSFCQLLCQILDWSFAKLPAWVQNWEKSCGFRGFIVFFKSVASCVHQPALKSLLNLPWSTLRYAHSSLDSSLSPHIFYCWFLTQYRNGHCFPQFLSHMTWPSWWQYSDAVQLLLSCGATLRLLKDHSHRTPGFI